MELWLATPDLALVERYLPTGVFAGVITNPTVVAEARRPAAELFADLCARAPAAWYQLADGDPDAMEAEALRFLEIDPEKMRIKVPATLSGLETIHRLTRAGHRVMATCVPTQAWMIYALNAGARYVAPYGGMLQKRGLASKADEVVAMQALIDRQGYDATICTGLYDVTEIPFYARNGIRAGFVWGADVDRFLTQPLVQEAVDRFADDWAAIEAAGR